MLTQVIATIQKVINLGDAERLFKNTLGINVPVHQMVKWLLEGLIPFGGGTMIYNAVNNNIQEFLHTPAKELAERFANSPTTFRFREDFTFELFGHKITIPQDPEIAAQEASMNTWMIAGLAFAAIMLMRKS